MAIKFSIITVSFNSEKTIEQTINSVLKQDYINLEYIIIDGASTDKTVDIIKQYAEIDNRIHFVSEPDNGIYDAMNKGIRLATGNVIGLLNSDDYYEPSALQCIADHIPEGTEYFVIYGMARFLKNEKETMVVLNNHNNLPEKMIMHPASFVSSSIYEKYQYDTEYKSAADYDLFIKLYNDDNITFVPVYSIITNFRIGGMSSSIISVLETNGIKYKNGYINKYQYLVRNLGIKIKHVFIKYP